MATRSPHEMLDEIQMQYNVVRHSLEQLGVMIANFRDTVPAPLQVGPRPRQVGRIKSLDTWVGWLRDNGPAYRKDIADATGLNLATNATAQVRPWREHMENWGDGQLSDDALLNITGPRVAVGRPPVIYFLWSQRYDLLPRYGVGPEKPPSAMTGVIQPPTDGEFVSPDTVRTVWSLPPSDEWDELTMDDLYNAAEGAETPDLTDGQETQSNEDGDGHG